jgi:hypothetical protein
VPDLIAAVSGGITPAQLAKIRKLGGVAAVLPVDGGKVTVNGKSADVLGVSPQAFRPWTPLATAASTTIWSDLSKGQLITTAAAAKRLHLTAGQSYPVSAAVLEHVPFGEPSELSVPGADAIVNLTRSAQLGLAKNFAVLINAPRDNLASLKAQVEVIIGKGGHVVNLVAYTLNAAGSLPVEVNAPTGVPANWIDLFKASAAQYCPGLSWTVLAAIGEIESGDGANEGPSSAGAEGPMQFLACCARPAGEAPRPCPGRSSPTTTPPGTSTRCWPWPASTPRTTPDQATVRPGPAVTAGAADQPGRSPRSPRRRRRRTRTPSAGRGRRG